MVSELRPLLSLSEVKSTWAAGKIPGMRSITNFFLTDEAIARGISYGNFFGAVGEGASVILRRDRDFFHIYLNCTSIEVCTDLVKEICVDDTFVADIVQRRESHQALIEVLNQCGFSVHRELIRLGRKAEPLSTEGEVGASSPADASEASEILRLLEIHFDRYSEQLPMLDEISEAITKGEIHRVSLDGELAGFLYFNSIGRTSVLRYWFVKPQYRDSRIGAHLIRNYLDVHCAGMSSNLWVVDNNLNATKRYRHYGYIQEDLQDQVLIRRGDHGNGNIGNIARSSSGIGF